METSVAAILVWILRKQKQSGLFAGAGPYGLTHATGRANVSSTARAERRPLAFCQREHSTLIEMESEK